MSKTKTDFYVIATIEIDLKSMTELQAKQFVKKLNRNHDVVDKIENYVTRILPDNAKAGNFVVDQKTLSKIE